MNRIEARKILGNQPKWALQGMALALQLHSWKNTVEENQRLMALRALGYKVYIHFESVEAVERANALDRATRAAGDVPVVA